MMTDNTLVTNDLSNSELMANKSMANEFMKNNIVIFDTNINFVGESPLWHPSRNTLFWLDFPNQILFSRHQGLTQQLLLSEMTTALGWIDDQHLLLACTSGLYQFHIDSQLTSLLCPLTIDPTVHRTNDGRADPWGGFWISIMGINAEDSSGAFYRWYQGELRPVIPSLTIPNGVCFDKNRTLAYYADSAEKKMYSLALDPNTGWPIQDTANLFYDFNCHNASPDGAVVDLEGQVWVAMWDGRCVLSISPDGNLTGKMDTETSRPTCPAFGGLAGNTMFVTTAQCGLESTAINQVAHGVTLQFDGITQGVASPAVVCC